MADLKINKLNIHHEGSEYLERCKLCGGEVKLVREGSILNPVSDITQCSCSTIEHENGVEIMGQKLHFGYDRVIR